MKKNVFILILILIVASVSASEDETTDAELKKESSLIYGHVEDRCTGADLKFANVALYDANGNLIKGAITNKRGYFIITKLAKGDYFIQVSHVGYKSSKKIAFRVSSGNKQLRVKKLSLEPSVISIDEVFVCKRKTDQSAPLRNTEFDSKFLLLHNISW